MHKSMGCMTSWWSTDQLANLAGVSKRQLQWWDERGYVIADRWQYRRRYTRRTALAAMILGEVLRKRFPHRAAGELAHRIQHLGFPLPDDSWLVVIQAGRRYRLYSAQGHDGLTGMLCAAAGPMWVIDMERLERRLGNS